MSLNLNEIIDAVQAMIDGDDTTLAKINKLLPLGIRLHVGISPHDQLAIKWNGTLDGVDYVNCPTNPAYGEPLIVWIDSDDDPADMVSAIEFAALEIAKYSGSQRKACPYVTSSGQSRIQFLPAPGVGTAITLKYYVEPSINAIAYISNKLADVIISWLCLKLQKDETEWQKNRIDYERSLTDRNKLFQSNPGQVYVMKIPDELVPNMEGES